MWLFHGLNMFLARSVYMVMSLASMLELTPVLCRRERVMIGVRVKLLTAMSPRSRNKHPFHRSASGHLA
ncbi:hypothetical protein ACN38_g5000 [Penicillium nordicum]|uniref:Uncharacterized protein n=1 Tax=Penicillium nordicum TaxID=229535 RepID=A0A0M8PB31_9EURO|nr:hypothetical protein ACN38_g5000 [Penicillium nordicum]